MYYDYVSYFVRPESIVTVSRHQTLSNTFSCTTVKDKDSLIYVTPAVTHSFSISGLQHNRKGVKASTNSFSRCFTQTLFVMESKHRRKPRELINPTIFFLINEKCELKEGLDTFITSCGIICLSLEHNSSV